MNSFAFLLGERLDAAAFPGVFLALLFILISSSQPHLSPAGCITKYGNCNCSCITFYSFYPRRDEMHHQGTQNYRRKCKNHIQTSRQKLITSYNKK
jgi:hypothetical protein